MKIEEFFKDVIAQNEKELRKYFCEDALIYWHCTNELFTVDEYIKANCTYPGNWNGEIERIEKVDDLYILAARVYPKDEDGSYHVVSFIKLKDERIISIDEYWADDGEAPKWRKKMNIGRKIKDEL